MIKFIFKILIFVLWAVSATCMASDNSWLHGNWLLTHDPDGDTQDRITFTKGSVFTTTEVATGRQLKGMYFINKDHIKVNLFNSGKIIMKFRLTFDDIKDKLYYKSSDSNSVSYYTKITK